VLYRFEIENTGDAKPDAFIDVTFGPRTAPNLPQTATIKLPGGKKGSTFTAPTTIATQAATAPAPTITTDAESGVSFFAGEVDDPFFFDIPAFARFLASVKTGKPDPTVFQRGRDTFAGYNILTIALRVPRSFRARRTPLGAIPASLALGPCRAIESFPALRRRRRRDRRGALGAPGRRISGNRHRLRFSSRATRPRPARMMRLARVLVTADRPPHLDELLGRRVALRGGLRGGRRLHRLAGQPLGLR